MENRFDFFQAMEMFGLPFQILFKGQAPVVRLDPDSLSGTPQTMEDILRDLKKLGFENPNLGSSSAYKSGLALRLDGEDAHRFIDYHGYFLHQLRQMDMLMAGVSNGQDVFRLATGPRDSQEPHILKIRRTCATVIERVIAFNYGDVPADAFTYGSSSLFDGDNLVIKIDRPEIVKAIRSSFEAADRNYAEQRKARIEQTSPMREGGSLRPTNFLQPRNE